MLTSSSSRADTFLVESTNPVKKDDAMDVAEEADKTTSVEPATSKKSAKPKLYRSRHTRNAITFPSLRRNAAKKAGKSKRKA
jgi:hypothetical protein